MYPLPTPLSRDFKITKPLPLIALALVSVAFSLVAFVRTRRHDAPEKSGPPTQTNFSEWKDRAPVAIKRLAGKLAIYPPSSYSSPWYLTDEDRTAGDGLVAAEDTVIKAGDGEIAARSGSRFRLWQAATATVLTLEQGEVVVAGPIEIRLGSVAIKTAGAVGVRMTESSLVLVAQRGAADVGGKPLAEGAIAEMKAGVMSPIEGSIAELLKWADDAKARK